MDLHAIGCDECYSLFRDFIYVGNLAKLSFTDIPVVRGIYLCHIIKKGDRIIRNHPPSNLLEVG
jgi:hypothetical protein